MSLSGVQSGTAVVDGLYNTTYHQVRTGSCAGPYFWSSVLNTHAILKLKKVQLTMKASLLLLLLF